jgi:hypothetical protein
MEEQTIKLILKCWCPSRSSWCSRISLLCPPRNLRSLQNPTTCPTYSARLSVAVTAASNCPTRPNLNLTNSKTSRKCWIKEELLPLTLLGLKLLTQSTNSLKLISLSKRIPPPILLVSMPTCSSSTSSRTINLRIKLNIIQISSQINRLIWLRIWSLRCRDSRTPNLLKLKILLTTCLRLTSNSSLLAWTTLLPLLSLLPNPTLLVQEPVTNLNSIWTMLTPNSLHLSMSKEEEPLAKASWVNLIKLNNLTLLNSRRTP